MDALVIIKQEDIKQECTDSTYECLSFNGASEMSFGEAVSKLEQTDALQVKAEIGHLDLDKAKLFQCPNCSFCSSRKIDLRYHRKVHRTEKLFECQFCKFTCAYKRNLTRHMQIHSGNKPFQCSVCRYASSQNGNLRRHMQSHFDPGPFKCSFCGHTTFREADMRKHMRVHTGEKPFRCAVCKFRASQRRDLQNHMRIHERGSEAGLKCVDYTDQEESVKVELSPIEEIIIKSENDAYS